MNRLARLLSRIPQSAQLYLILSGVFFTLAQSSVKFAPSLPTYEIVFFRSLISGLLTYYAIRQIGISPWGRNKPMLLLRGFLGTTTMVLFFYTIKHMPLATAVTIHYSYPIFTVLMAALFLKERPTWLQGACLAVSFVGILLVKGFDSRVDLAVFGIGILASMSYGGALTFIRALKNDDHPFVVILYLPLVSVIGLFPFVVYQFVMPEPGEWLAIFAIGIFAQLGQYYMTRAYHLDRAANITNLNYLNIVYAMLIGMAFLGEAVEPLALVGMAVIIASTTFSAQLGRRAKRSVVAVPPEQA